MHYALNPMTMAVPNTFIAAGDPEELRNVAFGIEDSIANGGDIVFERPGLLFLRSVCLDLADRIERDG